MDIHFHFNADNQTFDFLKYLISFLFTLLVGYILFRLNKQREKVVWLDELRGEVIRNCLRITEYANTMEMTSVESEYYGALSNLPDHAKKDRKSD